MRHAIIQETRTCKCFNMVIWFILFSGIGCVTPVNDITGSEASRYTKNERLARCRLAALYRLVDLNGWSMQIFNHISVSGLASVCFFALDLLSVIS